MDNNLCMHCGKVFAEHLPPNFYCSENSDEVFQLELKQSNILPTYAEVLKDFMCALIKVSVGNNRAMGYHDNIAKEADTLTTAYFKQLNKKDNG